MERSLDEVIAAVLNVTPQDFEHRENFSLRLKSISDSYRYSPPENLKMWWCEFAMALEGSLGNPDTEWKQTICDIVSAKLDYQDYLPKEKQDALSDETGTGTFVFVPERFTFFWNGPFSQWHPSPFRDSDGYTYNCAEQYMMAKKALFFSDMASYEKIMQETSPRIQKQLGRAIANFDKDKWDQESCRVVRLGSFFKFSQNPLLLAHLIATDGTTIVEASPEDKIWGIGLAEDNPLAQKRETWQGENRLGAILTELRATILQIIVESPMFYA